MKKSQVVLLLIVVFLYSCRKEASVRRTDISGRVTHYGKTSAEPGMKVAAIAYYPSSGLFSKVVTRIIDSALTDANGNYSMQFSTDINRIDSMYVTGYEATLSTSVRVMPGKINGRIDLQATKLPPVIAYRFRVINNNNPPLVLSFTPADSIIVTALSADITAYRVNHSLYLSSYSHNDKVNAYFSGYYYQGGAKKIWDFIEPNIPYQDTIDLPVTVDASIFHY